MARLNDMLAKNGNLSQTLEEDNFSLEAEFINRLKDAEQVRWRSISSRARGGALLTPPHRTYPSCRPTWQRLRRQRLFWSRS